MFAWQSPASSLGLDADLIFNPSAPFPPIPKKNPSTLVKVLAASLNPAELKASRAPLLAPIIKKPFTPGFDFVGTVVESSAGFAPGDLVAGLFGRIAQHGALAEYVRVLPGDLLVKLDPAQKSRALQIACAGVAGVTAYSVLEGLSAGDKVFINGSSGGAGTLCVQMAKRRGLVVVATCSGRNAELVRGMGAEYVLDYTKVDVLEALAAHVEETGVPVARAVDNVGGRPELFYQAHRYLGDGGEYHLVATAPDVVSMAMVGKMAMWPGFLGGGKRKLRVVGGAPPFEAFEAVVGMIAKGDIEVVLDEVFELEKAREAYKKLREGRARGKIVVRVST